jgi:glycosyltransferase involved in cell wall biosynthesis
VKIAILLAAYNGERFISALLKSLIKQSRRADKILVRDDGSSDGTMEILKEYQRQEATITILTGGKRVGAKGNFSELLLQAGEFDLVFLADQDDLWHPNKVEIMEERAQEEARRWGKEVPLLIHSDLRVIDEGGRVIAPSFWRYQGLDPKVKGLPSLLMQNNVTGAALCMNKSLVKKGLPISSEAVMHDHWFALVAALFGKIIAIERPLVDYRQHGTNVVGAKRYRLLRAIGCFKPIKIPVGQGKALLERYSNEIDGEKKSCLDRFVALVKRPWFLAKIDIIRGKFYRQGLLRNIALFLCPFRVD